jgi:hypothetical protein
MAEPDDGIPGASVAFVLSDAAARVAATAGSTNAAVSLTQLAAVLRQYALAFGALDVSATRQLWPSVDERTLANTFGHPASRQVSLDSCDINVEGSTANALCRGNATVLDGVEWREARLWRFDLRREGETWRIAHAETTPR